MEEALESAVSPILQRLTYDPDATWDWSEIIRDGLIGAAIGGVMGGVGGSANESTAYRDTQQAPQTQQTPVEQPEAQQTQQSQTQQATQNNTAPYTQQERLLTQAAACTAGQGNFHCGAAAPETMEAAHESGLSCGKYLAYLELKALDPDVTVEEAEGMTMAELRRATAALSGEEADAAYPGRGSGGSGNGSGNGNGHHGHHGRSASCARETVSSAAFGSRFFPVCP